MDFVLSFVPKESLVKPLTTSVVSSNMLKYPSAGARAFFCSRRGIKSPLLCPLAFPTVSFLLQKYPSCNGCALLGAWVAFSDRRPAFFRGACNRQIMD